MIEFNHPIETHVALSAKRIVIKVGSNLITNELRGVKRETIFPWAQQIKELLDAGREIIWVSSGAVAQGMFLLGWQKRPHSVDELQAAASVGQMGLIECYRSALAEHGLLTAQVLLTHEDLANRRRYLNARSTLLALLKNRVIPICNENDTVVTDEIKFGDNDTLSALITNLIEADLLIILTDQAGLFTANPRQDVGAKLIKRASANDSELQKMAQGAGSAIGTGGMTTKLSAARRAAQTGAHCVIVYGGEPDVLQRIVLKGEYLGSLLTNQTVLTSARKQWFKDHIQLQGWLIVDDGAKQKLLHSKGVSLLPIGVKHVFGEFQRGDVIAVRDLQGVEIARGMANYSSSQARLIQGKPSADIERILGFNESNVLIHRDNLVVINEAKNSF